MALVALSVGRPVCCSFVEPLPSWPGLSRPSTPGRRKNESRLGATGRKADGRKAFRACLRRCAGPSWMAGTSPAMTPWWRRPPPPPCSQFFPHNSQRDKSANFGSLALFCWRTGLLFVRRTLAVMAGLVPVIHAGPPQERVPPRRDRQEGGRSQGFSRLPASMRWAFVDGRGKPGHDALMAPSATSAMLPIPSPQQITP